jgi:hypothetical protein
MSDAKTSKVGGIVALIGAGLMAAMVWAPWIGGGADTISGWDIHQEGAGSERWYIPDMLDPDFSPLFPALPILIGAGVVALFALLMLSSRPLSTAGARVGALIGALVFLLSIVNPISVMQTDTSDLVSLEWGLIGVAVGGFVGLLGLWMGGRAKALGKKTGT